MSLVIENYATHVVPENFILIFMDGTVKGKKYDNTLVEVDADDMLRLGLSEADLPCYALESDYVEAHGKANVNNLDIRSVMQNRAAVEYTNMVANAKLSKSVFVTEKNVIENKIAEVEQTTGSNNDAVNAALEAEVARATGAEATLQANIDAEATRAGAAEADLQSKIDAEATARTDADTAITTSLNEKEAAIKAEIAAMNFGTLIDRIWIYGENIFDLNLMVKPGMYFCSTNAVNVGTPMTNMPEGVAEGCLLVLENSQIFFEGGTNKGRIYYRYQTGAENKVSAYTEAWNPSAQLSDVTELRAFVEEKLGELDGNVGEALDKLTTDLATLRTEAEATAGADAIVVAGTNATKNISLKLDGNDRFLSQSADGLKVGLDLVKITDAAVIGDANVATRYEFRDRDGNKVGSAIDVLKDRFLKSLSFVEGETDGGDLLRMVCVLADGTESTTDIPLAGLFDEYSAANGVKLEGFVFSGVVDGTSSKVITAEGVESDVLTVGADGFKVANIQIAIDYAVGVEAAARGVAEKAITDRLDVIEGTEEGSIKKAAADAQAAAEATASADATAKANAAQAAAIAAAAADATAKADAAQVAAEATASADATAKADAAKAGAIETAAADATAKADAAQAAAIETAAADATAKADKALEDAIADAATKANAAQAAAEAKAAELDAALHTTVSGEIATAKSEAIAAAEAGMTEHNTDAKHNAEIVFVRSALTATMEYKHYICKAALNGTLPAAPAEGTKRVVSVVAGGEATMILPGAGDTIQGSADAIVINMANDTVTFIYDAIAKDWVVL